MVRKFCIRVQRVLMSIAVKIRFGKKIKLDGVAGLRYNTEVIIRKGGIRIGAKSGVDSGVTLAAVDGGQIILGQKCFLNRNCILVSREKIQIGDRCQFGPNTVLYDHDHKFGMQGIEKGYKTGAIIIENNCWLGANVTVLRGTHIGEGCVIGAGAVVKGDIPPHSLVTADRGLNIVPIVDKKQK